jgi:hypothetical protein
VDLKVVDVNVMDFMEFIQNNEEVDHSGLLNTDGMKVITIELSVKGAVI